MLAEVRFFEVIACSQLCIDFSFMIRFKGEGKGIWVYIDRRSQPVFFFLLSVYIRAPFTVCSYLPESSIRKTYSRSLVSTIQYAAGFREIML